MVKTSKSKTQKWRQQIDFLLKNIHRYLSAKPILGKTWKYISLLIFQITAIFCSFLIFKPHIYKLINEYVPGLHGETRGFLTALSIAIIMAIANGIIIIIKSIIEDITNEAFIFTRYHIIISFLSSLILLSIAKLLLTPIQLKNYIFKNEK